VRRLTVANSSQASIDKCLPVCRSGLIQMAQHNTLRSRQRNHEYSKFVNGVEAVLSTGETEVEEKAGTITGAHLCCIFLNISR
jgi:hypothetical protein